MPKWIICFWQHSHLFDFIIFMIIHRARKNGRHFIRMFLISVRILYNTQTLIHLEMERMHWFLRNCIHISFLFLCCKSCQKCNEYVFLVAEHKMVINKSFSILISVNIKTRALTWHWIWSQKNLWCY